MSKRNRNTLLGVHAPGTGLSTSNPSTPAAPEVDHLENNCLQPFNKQIYPFNDGATEPTYPDFNPWKDEYSQDDRMNLHLSKGFYETPVVSNEYCSARHLIQHTLFINVDNCSNVLNELSQHLSNAYKHRNEVINKIKYDSNHFALPPRVTLTSAKKEAWLKDLANNEVPLRKVGEKLPHGFRNKVLIDAVCSRNVPLNRAIWFTKCSVYGEYMMVEKKKRVKQSPSKSGSQALDFHWLQEWTQQVADYVYKYGREMDNITTVSRKTTYMAKYNYMISYITQLYIECLIDKTYFLTFVSSFLMEGLTGTTTAITTDDEDLDEDFVEGTSYRYGQRLVALQLVELFWHDFLKSDFLLKELCSGLLLNYNYCQKHGGIYSSMLPAITEKVMFLFKKNMNLFIIPAHWSTVQKSVWQILDSDPNPWIQEHERHQLRKHLELIKYRNESLMFNYSAANRVQGDLLSYRSSDDLIRLIHQWDHYRLTDHLVNVLTRPGWRVHLRALLSWSVISPVNSSTEAALMVCQFLKKSVVTQSSRVEVENEIVDVIYQIAEVIPSSRLHHFYVLINELYQLKLLTIAGYLRRLIASGLFRDLSSPLVKVHVNILHNLPTINNKQSNNILRKVGQCNDDFSKKFEEGKLLLETELLEKVVNNSLGANFLEKMEPIIDLEVGLKFLLINWLTNEFKSRLSATSKLIHITPEMVTHLYSFYRATDNLPMFFKEIVRFILRNTAGVIICYMDSLYLLARLVMFHMPLIKFVTSSSSDLMSVGYSLFELMARLYLELSTREFDWFNFSVVWQFMESKIDKRAESRQTQSLSPLTMQPGVASHRSPPSKTPMFEMAVDSPMRFTDELVNSPKASVAELVSLLAAVQRVPVVELSPEELSEIYAGVGIDHSVSAAVQALKNPDSHIELLVKLLKYHSMHNAEEYKEAMEQMVSEMQGEEACKQAIGILGCYELLPLTELAQMLSSVPQHVAWLLVGEVEGLTAAMQIQLEAVRCWFKHRHPAKYTELMVAVVQSGIAMPKFMKTSIASRDVTVMAYAMNLAPENILCLVNSLNPFSKEIIDASSIVEVASEVDEFNLPFFQLALRGVVEGQSCLINEISIKLLLKFRFHFPEVNRFYGESFELLSNDNREKVVEHLEMLFLTGCKFDGSNVELVLNMEGTEVDVLPVLVDAFNKFTSGSSGMNSDDGLISTTTGPNDALAKFTANAVAAANEPIDNFTNLKRAISIFLRILIIYRSVIAVGLTNEVDSVLQFFKQLVKLLHSEFLVTGSKKLRIVLYDLLLLLKSHVSPASADDSVGVSESDGPASAISGIIALDELNDNFSFGDASNGPHIDSVGTLDPSELNGGDYNYLNHSGLVVSSSATRNSASLTNLLAATSTKPTPNGKKFSVKGFEIFEDISAGLNDGCMNLSLFDAFTTMENPP